VVRCTERIRKMGIKNKGDQKHMPPWLSRLLIATGLRVIMAQSSGNVLGYKVVGTVVKEDYATLTAEVEALLEQEETMSLPRSKGG
jgi:hypothetical protein